MGFVSTLGRWCGRGRSLFLSCSVFIFFLICHVLVGVGRLSAIIWDSVREFLFWLPSSQDFRTPVICSSYLVSSSVFLVFSCLFPFLLCGISAVAPFCGSHSFNTSLSCEQSNHHQTSIPDYIFIFMISSCLWSERRTTESHHKPSGILPTFHHEAAAIDANNIAAHLSQSACDEARIQSTYVLGDS